MNRMAPTRSALLSVTPMIPGGADLAQEVTFYKDQLGFQVLWEGAGMAGVARDSVSFHLVRNENREWAENASFSIGVSNLDALYEEYRDVRSARVGPLEMKVWGRREFHMVAPSGVCLQFYQHAG
jgi:glyoxalase/bleomycin resistance protein/dioxygenase superfamily protein